MYTKAAMTRYPYEPGAPNSIQCKTPIWNLTNGVAWEKVKLDIAVNGQDFKGGFDYYFT